MPRAPAQIGRANSRKRQKVVEGDGTREREADARLGCSAAEHMHPNGPTRPCKHKYICNTCAAAAAIATHQQQRTRAEQKYQGVHQKHNYLALHVTAAAVLVEFKLDSCCIAI